MTIAYALVGTLIGACLGSFASASSYRIPRGISLGGRSECECGTPIPAWRNIPIITWLIQGGRAACCEARIPLSVLLTEVGGAAIGAGVGALLGVWGLVGLGVIVFLWVGALKLYFRKGPESEED